ncbi:MAG: phage BR0599 family protein, partial [Armatimonadetes bacterium]|nr:phage BR0599 family protein [Armatimonadota bacterium]
VRLILTSTGASGESVTLELNAPLRFAAAGAAVTLLPGCDGRWNTCDTKFNNEVNFGGHRFALSNLAVKALAIPASAGGKK